MKVYHDVLVNQIVWWVIFSTANILFFFQFLLTVLQRPFGMSAYSRKMARLSARIFGEVARPTSVKSTKVVRIFSEKPKHLDKRVVDYYPPYKDLTMTFATLRNYGLFRQVLINNTGYLIYCQPNIILMFNLISHIQQQ